MIGLTPSLITGSAQVQSGGLMIALGTSPTQLHAPDGAGDRTTYDDLDATVCNNSLTRQTVTFIVGSDSAVPASNLVVYQIPPQAGPYQAFKDFPLLRGLPVWGFCGVADVCNVSIRVKPSRTLDLNALLEALGLSQ